MFYWVIWPRISFNYCQIFAVFDERDALHFENHKKMWRKVKKIIFEFVFNSLLIWNFQNSKFEFQISEPTRLFRRQSVNWNRCSIFFHWTKKSLCWNLMKSSRDPCKTKKEAKVGSSTYTKVFWLSLFSVLDVVRP